MTKKYFVIAGIILSIIHACRNKVDQAADDEYIKIEEFIQNIEVDTVTENGVHYIEDTAGTGDTVFSENFISIDFSGCKLENKLPEEYTHTNFTFIVNSGQVIRGINEGILLMREGTTGRLIIPFEMAYYSPISSFNNYNTYIFKIHVNRIIENPKEWELNRIYRYILDNNYNVQPDTNGYCIIEIEEGDGETILLYNKVELGYTCKLLNEEVLLSSESDQNTFTLNYDSLYFFNDTILNRPLYNGLTKMKENGKSIIIIPSNQAFGSKYIGTEIQSYSTFIFEIYSISVLD
ncbi:FKBP-type peptidyl-prolyl cis-trans isomerase [Bacteroidota bacterium]